MMKIATAAIMLRKLLEIEILAHLRSRPVKRPWRSLTLCFSSPTDGKLTNTQDTAIAQVAKIGKPI
jgi:hypothetical protein